MVRWYAGVIYLTDYQCSIESYLTKSLYLSTKIRYGSNHARYGIIKFSQGIWLGFTFRHDGYSINLVYMVFEYGLDLMSVKSKIVSGFIITSFVFLIMWIFWMIYALENYEADMGFYCYEFDYSYWNNVFD